MHLPIVEQVMLLSVAPLFSWYLIALAVEPSPTEQRLPDDEGRAGPIAAAANEERFEKMQKVVARLKEQVADLESNRAAGGENPAAASAWPPAPEWKSADGNFSFKPRARVDVDVAVFHRREGSLDYDGGADFRRVRLGMEGRAYGRATLKIEADFSDGDAALKDAFVSYESEGGTLKIGHHKAPFTLADMTPVSDLAFMERPLLVEALGAGAGRKIGLSFATGGDAWTTAVGIFGDAADGTGLEQDGWSINGRVTFVPLQRGDRILHLGSSAYYRKESEQQVRLRSLPEIRVDGRSLVSTGWLPLDHYRFAGAEIAATMGSSAVVAEWGHVEAVRPESSDLSFDGGYLSFNHFLTGEKQSYRGGEGILQGIQPASAGEGRLGSWEVAVRYGWVDLEDAGVRGGVQRDLTLAANWYFLPRTRLQLNYIRFDVSDTIVDPPRNFDGSPAAGDLRGAVYGARLQVIW